jgi:amidophosphoribosyltransferase
MLVDDSIVRGTTCKEIVQMARDAGARKVYFASAAPPVRYPNVYGIDMPSVNELIAHDKSVEEIGKLIGADWLLYQDLDDLITCVNDVNPEIEGWECSVFTGEYIAGDVDAAYLEKLEAARNDEKRFSAGSGGDMSDNGIIDLYNDED